MVSRDRVLSVRLGSPETDMIRRAFAAEQRVRLMGVLGGRTMTVNEIAAALDISQPNASIHIRVLEETGLIGSKVFPTAKGSEKRCWLNYDSITIESPVDANEVEEEVMEMPIPVGLFTALSVPDGPFSGWASYSGLVLGNGLHDMLNTKRTEAQTVWLRAGWLEYTLPLNLPQTAEITAIEFEAEVCSEAGHCNNDFPSDITLWINGVETATWTSPGDLGGIRGRLNPDWWANSWTQYGLLKTWRIDEGGSSIDGAVVGSTRLAELGLRNQSPIVLRIGVKEDAENPGGFNIFGKRLGNHPEDPTLRVQYTLLASESGRGRG